MKNWLFLSVLTILLASCSEPTDPGDPPPTGDTCSYFLNDAINNIMAQWVYPTYLVQTVSINPNNADEFAYIRKHVANNTIELRKRNIATGVDTWLADFSGTLRSLSWSKQGYIYHNTQHELHRVKEDGSTHDVYTYGAVLTRPICSPNGEMVLVDFTTFNPSAGYCAILDKNGNFLDSIEPGEQILFSWIDDEHVIFWEIQGSFKIVNINTKQVTEQGQMPEYQFLLHKTSLPNKYVSYDDGNIYIYDRISKTTMPIKTNCKDNYLYTIASTAESLNKIVSLYHHYSIIDSVQYIYGHETYVVRMNVDGSGEEIVLLSD